MKRSTLFLSWIILLVIAGCDGEDDENGSPGNLDNSLPFNSSGTISATYEVGNFSSNNVTARYRSNSEKFMILAQNTDYSELDIILDSFDGNGIYQVGGENRRQAEFYNNENGNMVYYFDGEGTLSIQNYDSAEESFEVSFDLTFIRAIEGGTINLSGSSSELQIVQMPEPESGEVYIFDKSGSFYNQHSTFAQVTHTDILDIDFLVEIGLDSRIQVLMQEVENPESITVKNDLWRDIQDESIIYWEYDGENQLLSAHLKDFLFSDFEIWFVDMPFSRVPQFNLSDGDVVFVHQNDTTYFEAASFEVEFLNEQYSTFEAVNTEGEKLYFQTSLPIPYNPQYDSPYIGTDATLLYFENEADLNPSSSYVGIYTTLNTEQNPSVGDVNFVSTDGETILKAKGIPFF